MKSEMAAAWIEKINGENNREEKKKGAAVEACR